MKISRAVPASAALGFLLAAGGCYSQVKTSDQADAAGAALDRRELAEATVANWSTPSSLTAKKLMAEYGVPDEVHGDRIVWIGNSPWRRTVAFNVRGDYAAPGSAGSSTVEQTVDYSLTPQQAAGLASFDSSVSYNPRSGELTSRADREEHNFLRMNLADDVAHGRLTPEAARDSYASVVSFEESGKTSPYLLGLRFLPAPETR